MLKTRLLLLLFLFAMPVFMAVAKDVAPEQLTYDIKCGGNGTQGYYIVEVSAYVNNSGSIQTQKVGKQYKVTAVVSVAKDQKLI